MQQPIFDRYRLPTAEERQAAMLDVLGRIAALETHTRQLRNIARPLLVGGEGFGASWYDDQITEHITAAAVPINEDFRRLGGIMTTVIDPSEPADITVPQPPKQVRLTGWGGISADRPDHHIWQHDGDDPAHPATVQIPSSYLSRLQTALQASS